MTISRAGLISGGALLTALLLIQFAQIGQNAGQDSSSALGRVALAVIVVVGTFGVFIYLNRARFTGSKLTSSWIKTQVEKREWICAIRIDMASQRTLGIAPRQVETFGLMKSAHGLEFWDLADSSAPIQLLAPTQIESLELVETAWFSESGGHLILEIVGESRVVPIDVVGPLWGTLPLSRKQSLRIRDIALSADR